MVKKPKILADIDEFVLEKLKGVGKSPDEELTVANLMPKCKKCFGTMERIVPVIELPAPELGGILELHQCVSCGEREYL